MLTITSQTQPAENDEEKEEQAQDIGALSFHHQTSIHLVQIGALIVRCWWWRRRRQLRLVNRIISYGILLIVYHIIAIEHVASP